MLPNMIGGLQGIIDHAMVGHFVGFTGNAAIGVGWQIFIVVIVFITSLFTGMSVLVARFAGAGDDEKVDRTVYQAFLTAIGAVARRDGAGRLLRCRRPCSTWCNAAPEVQAQALPFLRIMFVFSSGMLIFFMLGGALRSAGDARTPMILGIAMTRAEHRVQRHPDPRPRADPGVRHAGAAMGTSLGVRHRSGCSRCISCGSGGWVVSFPRHMGWRPTGRSSGRCSGSACRPACRASR